MRYRCCNLIHNMITGFPPDPDPEPPAELPLILTFNDINNFGLVADVNNVNDWNTFLVASGNPYTSVVVTGNVVELYGGSNVVIGDSLFIFDSTLVSIYDTNTVVRLGASDLGAFTFWFTSALETVEMQGVQIISGDVFNNSSITSGVFESVEIVYDAGFTFCSNLTTLTILGVLTLHESAVDGTAITELIIPNCTETVGPAINNNLSLQTIDVSGCILWGGISNCPLVTNISLPVATLLGNDDTQAFYQMDGLTTISAPNATVLKSEAGVYEGLSFCNALTSVDLSSCTTFGNTVGDDDVFNNTNNLTCTLTVPVSLQTADGGNPDGDLVTFLANNPLSTINYVV